MSSDGKPKRYTLKPLVFADDAEYGPSYLSTTTIFGRLFVPKSKGMQKALGWFLEVGSVGGKCMSVEDGIRRATEWYESAIADALIAEY